MDTTDKNENTMDAAGKHKDSKDSADEHEEWDVDAAGKYEDIMEKLISRWWFVNCEFGLLKKWIPKRADSGKVNPKVDANLRHIARKMCDIETIVERINDLI